MEKQHDQNPVGYITTSVDYPLWLECQSKVEPDIRVRRSLIACAQEIQRLIARVAELERDHRPELTKATMRLMTASRAVLETQSVQVEQSYIARADLWASNLELEDILGLRESRR